MTGVEIAAGITLADAFTAASAIVGAIGALQQASATRATHEYNARVAEADAIAARQAADYEEARHRERVKKLLSAQQARAGSASGSALLLLAETAEDAELDAIAIRYSGSVEEARATSRAAGERLQAASTSGALAAGATLLGAAGKIASRPKAPAAAPEGEG